MFTFASTVITGVFSMAFSKNVIEHEGVVSGSKSFYDLSINDINGEKINLEKFKGKKVMIVNVASRCGYTSQYEDLQSLYEKNKDILWQFLDTQIGQVHKIVRSLESKKIPYQYFDLDTDSYKDVFGFKLDLPRDYTSHVFTWIEHMDRHAEVEKIA